jgi:hypothetical protein
MLNDSQLPPVAEVPEGQDAVQLANDLVET